MKKNKNHIYPSLIYRLVLIVVLVFATGALCSCDFPEDAEIGSTVSNSSVSTLDPDNLPEFDGDPYVTVNGNEPEFDDELKTEESFEEYGDLDRLGRCTAALANLSDDTEPAWGEERGDIHEIHPSGWQSRQGWERCHLIAWSLSAENANERNLITGTHYFNGTMQPFEILVDEYIDSTGNHVLYEVIPYYEGDNPVASGVQMQAESVEDNGRAISFNIYCFNVQPGSTIDYETGYVNDTSKDVVQKYVLNTNSMKFHYSNCTGVTDMAPENRKVVETKRSELLKQGYVPCGMCAP